MTLSVPQLKQTFTLAGVILALATYVLGVQINRLNKLRSINALGPVELKRETDIKATKLAIAKKAPQFGFRNMVSNITYIDFMQYFGNQEARSVNGYGLGFDYFENILYKDPKFFMAYYFLSGTGSGYLGDPNRTISIMNDGFKSITPQAPATSYYLWKLKSTDELLFLGDVSAAKKSLATTVNWANQVGDEEAKRIADISQESIVALTKNPQSKLARFSAWASVFDNAVDLPVKKAAAAKIRELGGQVELDAQGKLKITPPATD
jgi:hypothetical protein